MQHAQVAVEHTRRVLQRARATAARARAAAAGSLAAADRARVRTGMTPMPATRAHLTLCGACCLAMLDLCMFWLTHCQCKVCLVPPTVTCCLELRWLGCSLHEVVSAS